MTTPTSPNNHAALTSLDPAAWWRHICFVPGTRLALSGDLPDQPSERAAHLQRWVDSGITHIIDVRAEWTDEKAVAKLQPQLRYHWIGVDDDGGVQPSEWFDAGTGAALEAFGDPRAKVMVHCHMGVNRGPTMAFAILLAMGWDPIEALAMIRNCRPIAGLIYAGQAVNWWHRVANVQTGAALVQSQDVNDWMKANPVNVGWIVSRIYRAEAA